MAIGKQENLSKVPKVWIDPRTWVAIDMWKAWIDQRKLVAIGCRETRVDPRERVTTKAKSPRTEVTVKAMVTTVWKVKRKKVAKARTGTMRNQAMKPRSPTQSSLRRARHPVAHVT